MCHVVIEVIILIIMITPSLFLWSRKDQEKEGADTAENRAVTTTASSAQIASILVVSTLFLSGGLLILTDDPAPEEVLAGHIKVALLYAGTAAAVTLWASAHLVRVAATK
jgi:hypothetical protein